MKRRWALVGIPSPEVSSSPLASPLDSSSYFSLNTFLLKNVQNKFLLLKYWNGLLRRFGEIELASSYQPATFEIIIEEREYRDELPTDLCWALLLLAVHYCANLKMISILNKSSAPLVSDVGLRVVSPIFIPLEVIANDKIILTLVCTGSCLSASIWRFS